MSSRMTPISRRLRRDMTPAEAKLWDKLRGGRLGGFKFRRQHPIAGRIADFACVELSLVIELDGAVHELPGAKEDDAERSVAIEADGWRILRFENREVLEEIDGVLDVIFQQTRCR